MGCGCAGSTPKTQQPPASQTPVTEAQVGGPGEEGYTWNGPPRPPAEPAAASE